MKNNDSSAQILNIERGLIAAILFDEEIFSEVNDSLVIEDFLYPSHQKIYDVCCELKAQNTPINADFVRARLQEKKAIPDEDFAQILATSPIANIEAYIKEIKNASIKRNLAKLAMNIATLTNDTSLQSEDILDNIEKEVYALSSKGAQVDFKHSKQVVLEMLESIKELKERGNNILVGLDTGFMRLNRYTTGFNAGELIVIGARPSMGKTALFLNMIQHTINRNEGVAVFSLEMPATHLMQRMLSSLTSIPLHDLRVGRLDDVSLEKLTIAMDKMAKRPLYIDESSSLTIAQLRSKLRKLKTKEPNLKMAVIDYLQLMRGSGLRRGDGARQEEISEISRGLKTLARDLEIPIIALSQLNRVVETREDKRPMLSDLRESGAIEQDADVILFLYRDDVYARRADREKIAKAKREGKDDEVKKLEEAFLAREREHTIEPAEIIIAKNRNGETGTVDIQFNKPFIRFEDKEKPQELNYAPTDTRIESDNSDVIETIQI